MKLNLHSEIFNDIYIEDLFNYEKRYQVFYGGAGSGKSVYVAQKLIVKALNDQRKILVLRKVGKTIKNSVFQLIVDILGQWQLLSECRVNKTDYSILLPSGSQFLFAGLDDSEKIKSIAGLTDAWLEEATEFILDDFNQIDLRIRHNTALNQQIYLSLNPVSKVNWVYLTFFSPEASKDLLEKTKIYHSTYKNNKFLPQSYIDSLLLLEKTNNVYYKIYALGEFGSLNKLVFTNWRVGEIIPPKDATLLCGLDFGYVNDACAFICSLLDEANKQIYVFYEHFEKGLLNNQIADLIKDNGFSKSLIIADSAEQKSIEEIKRLGVPRIKASEKGQGSILQGIQKLQQYEIIINPDCKNLIEEFQNYSWEKDKQTNEYINKPVDKYNHGIDALRYSLQCVGGKIKVYDKAIFGL